MLAASSDKLRGGGGEDGMPLVETGGLSPYYCRTSSCVEDPQGTALDALKAGDLRLLADLLSSETDSLEADKQYPTENFKTLLHLAVEAGQVDAVKILLSGGARPEHYNSALKLTVLHVVAGRGDTALLSLLLLHSTAGLDMKDRTGRTALHQAVSHGHLDCARTLCERGADVNLTDNKGGQTALLIAASAGSYELVRLLLSYGASLDGGAETVIRSKFSADQVQKLELEKVNTFNPDQVNQTLYSLLDTAELDGEDVERFRSVVRRAKPADLARDNGRLTLVQSCAERGLAGYLSTLLTAGADPNTFTVSRPVAPILLACSSGRAGVVKVMLEHNRLNINNNNVVRVDLTVTDQQFRQTVLHQILRKPKQNLQLTEKSGDYESCLDLILNSKINFSSLINKQDSLGNTALHYGTQFWDQDTVKRLLLLGANIGLRNNLGEAPISNILPSTMESFLNDHCIKSEGNPTNEDFKVSLHYDFLAPPRDSEPESDAKFAFSGTESKETPPPETDVLWFMARSKDHRHLLKHPVITSFLDLKWRRISVHYNSNMAFFGLFVIMLTLYIFTNYAGLSLNVTAPACPDLPWGNSLALWWTVIVLAAILVLREILQLSVHPSQYLTSFENILEIILIVLTFILLLYGNPGCDLQFKREISSASLLFSWILLVTMIGRHPQMLSFNIYSTMFYRVLKTFISFLAWYSLFIIAFAFSFYVLLHQDNGETDNKEYPFFDNLGLTLVKTFSMFIGELEFSDIPFNSPFSYIFFLLFIFLIVVVLMNLLNGLAVSDTGLIREEAEIHAHVSRVEVIAQVEATLLGDPAQLLRGQGWLGRLLPTCGLRRRIGSVLQCRSVFRTLTASKGILLFYSYLPNKKLVVYPNKQRMICSPCLSPTDVGREIVKSAKDLVLQLNESQKDKDDIQERIRTIQVKQDNLEVKIDEVIKTLGNLCKHIGNKI